MCYIALQVGKPKRKSGLVLLPDGLEARVMEAVEPLLKKTYM